MSLKKQALLLRVGFDLGRYSRSDVSDWVTAEIMEADQIDGPLLELGTLAGKSDEDISGLLRDLAGPVPEGLAARVEVGLVGRLVEAGTMKLEPAIRRLLSLVYEGLDEEEQGCIFQLDDAYDLAAAGTYGTMEQVRNDFTDFTGRYRDLVNLATYGPLPGAGRISGTKA